MLHPTYLEYFNDTYEFYNAIDLEKINHSYQLNEAEPSFAVYMCFDNIFGLANQVVIKHAKK